MTNTCSQASCAERHYRAVDFETTFWYAMATWMKIFQFHATNYDGILNK